MEQKIVILGMSGGVDSSVAALMLKKQGYKVIGIFMKNFSDTKDRFTGECWWRAELDMARKIANMLDISLYILDYEQKYKSRVIKPMIRSYKSGKTPNPDIDCNNLTKFPALLAAAKKFKADFIATGHYARIKKTNNKFSLFQGKDKTKDQSYFLYKLTQKELSKTIFPVGSLTKNQVRAIAKKNKFPNWDKHGSAGVCFIGNIPLSNYLKKHIKLKQGDVLDINKKIIGTHQGASFYTIGQRVGPRIGVTIKKDSQKKLYVAAKRENKLIVAPEHSKVLKIKSVKIVKTHFLSNIPKTGLKARIRHLGNLVPCTLKSSKVTFAKPQFGVASGQSLVLYKDQELIGGGEMRL
jgi:tRNA-specific 2-thiouridylase